MVPDAPEMQTCEHCGKDFDIEDCHMMGDCWFCDGCYKDWKQTFDSCTHEWEPEESEFGEPGRYCHKCCGFELDQQKASALLD
jgi:hypothetical protein